MTKVKDNPRAQEPYYIKKIIDNKKNLDIKIIPDLKIAIQKAKEVAKVDDLILITGSLFLVGEAERILKKQLQIVFSK